MPLTHPLTAGCLNGCPAQFIETMTVERLIELAEEETQAGDLLTAQALHVVAGARYAGNEKAASYLLTQIAITLLTRSEEAKSKQQ